MIKVRAEKPEDKSCIDNVIKEAFKHMPYSQHQEHMLIDRLRNSDAYVPELALVAEIDGKIVGFILFTEILIDDKVALALAPVGVLPEYQKSGVGKELINTGHEIARKKNYDGVLVLGNPNYYSKFGYIKASEYDIDSPFELFADDNYMACELSPGSLQDYRGDVLYAEEFFD
jgi:predicted N-acetyltransferase YhbS